MSKRLLRLLALFFAFSLVAAACGDSDGGDGDTSTGDADTAAEPADEEDESSIGGGLTQDALDAEDEEEEITDEEEVAVFDMTTMEGIEASWAHNRDGIVADLTAGIEAGDYGVGEDGVLRGPSGFEIDINECPGDWSDTGGITDTEVRLGLTLAQSGNLAAYGNIALGWQSYINYVNENGGIDGKDVVLIVKDDGYVAAQTIEFVDELIEAENVFYIVTLGSPNTLATYDKINEECIPQPFVMTGHPAWGDPVKHPWTSGLQLSYSTEAILWGNWIKANLADQLPVVVSGLVMDNDFGLAYEKGFEAYVEANPDVVSEFIAVRHDPAAPTLTNEVTTVAASDPDVFISMTAGNPCLLAIQEVEKAGLLETLDAYFTPSVCKGIAAYMTPAGDAADGWQIVGGGAKDTTDPNYIDEPFIAFLNGQLEADGLDPSISLLGTGFLYGWPNVEVTRIAAELPGGLTRTNFILALRSFSGTHPLLLDGMSFAADGAADAFFVEGSDFSVFDAENQSWTIVGDVVDVNGGSPNCAWNKDEGGCE
ncbi:MAG: branched-chain amino acid transport system substrate-binding protein [Candidatus Poriferisodalaceae bacterium]|jgi:branched-chain amino acid transport system substrate-binding protein